MSGWVAYGKVKVRVEWCKGCGICVALCPWQVLALDERGKVRVANEACNGCRLCEIHCPDFVLAIEPAGGGKADAAS